MMPRRTLRAFASRSWVLVPLAVLGAVFLGCSGGGGGGPTEPPPPPGGDNHAPTASLDLSPTHLTYGATATATVTAADVDGDQLTKSWSATNGTVASTGPTANTATFTAANTWGPATVTVTVTDGKGGSTPATASAYVRNPNPPAFTLRPVASTVSGCTGFALEITSPENVTIRSAAVWPDGPLGACAYNWTFSPARTLAAGVPYVLQNPNCIWAECSGDPVSYYEIVIWGTRPEPDGGEFIFDCKTWRPSSPGNCR